MSSASRVWRAVCVWGWAQTLLAVGVLAAHPARYVARFAAGDYWEGHTLSDWYAADLRPKLANRLLLDGPTPLRWLVDRALPPRPEQPAAWIELTTGDRFPAIVERWNAGDDSPYDPVPPHLVVRYTGPGLTSLEPVARRARLDLRLVRKVVRGNSDSVQTPPQTVVLRDGGWLRFRSHRWTADGVSLLLETGPRRVLWDELAEIDLGVGDSWHALWEELAELSPDGADRLIQVELTTGGVITSSLRRLQPRVLGDAKDPGRWLLGIQPAWSLDPLWIWQAEIRVRRLFSPNEVPLTRLQPLRETQRSVAAVEKGKVVWGPALFRYQVNRNLQDHPLRSGGQEAGWGFAVQAASDLEFTASPAVRAIHLALGIDAQMRGGGCVRGRVLWDGVPLAESPLLIGSQTRWEPGRIAVPARPSPRASQGKVNLILQVDPIATETPAGADPMDVHDQADWLEPWLELDPVATADQVRPRLPQRQDAWKGWNLTTSSEATVQYVTVSTPVAGNQTVQRTAVQVVRGSLQLTRSERGTGSGRWLVVDAVQTPLGKGDATLTVQVGSSPAVVWKMPTLENSSPDVPPLVLSIPERSASAPATATTPLRIEYRGDSTAAPILWRSLAVVDQHPRYYRLWEDEIPSGSAAGLPPTSLQLTVDRTRPYSGTSALQVPPGSPFSMPLRRPLAIRERPRLGEYRFLRFAWRRPGGGSAQFTLRHAEEQERPAVFVSGGGGGPAARNKKSVAPFDTAGEWQVVTRDLFADFGALDVTAWQIEFHGEGPGFIDHAYFTPSQGDCDRIPR